MTNASPGTTRSDAEHRRGQVGRVPAPRGPASPTAEFSDVDFDAFRTIMASFATGISVLTSVDDEGQPCGMTCSAVCSVSAAPPLLLCCVKIPSYTLRAIQARGRFAVNFLDADARAESDLFAGPAAPGKFGAIGWRPGEQVGMPLLDRTLAHAECTVYNIVEAGDHVIVLGRIVGGAVRPDRFPLTYWRGGYAQVLRVNRPRQP